MAKTSAKTVAASSRDLSKRVHDAHIGDKLSAGLSSVADPELVATVQQSAASLWSKASATAGSWWSSAAKMAADVLVEENGMSSPAGAAAAAPLSQSMRTASSQPVTAPVASNNKPAAAATDFDADWEPFVDEKDEATLVATAVPAPRAPAASTPVTRASLPAPAPVPAPARNPAAGDDIDWMQAQLRELGMHDVASPSSSVRPAAARTTPTVDDAFDVTPTSVPGRSPIAAAPTPAPAGIDDEDEFFAKFGVKS